MTPRGHLVVLGTAGSGKTLIASHRAVYLATHGAENHGRTLLVTFNKALVAFLRYQLAKRPPDLQVENYHTFARGYLASRGKMPSRNGVADPRVRADAIQAALGLVERKYKPHRIFRRPVEFFSDEISWLVGNGFSDDTSRYLEAPRVGRGTPLQSGERKVVTQVYAEYRRQIEASGHLYDWDSISSATRHELLADPGLRLYKHIVIDEGQDFSPEMIRSLAAAVDPSGSLTFFGDYAQQIYGQGMSWRSTGLHVPKVHEFKQNYRNSTQIAALALALANGRFFQGTADLVVPTQPIADGPKPTIVSFRTRSRELEFVVSQALSLGATGTVAVLFRDRADESDFVAGLARRQRSSRAQVRVTRLHRSLNSWSAGPGIFYGAYHSGKGLEFDSVLLPDCSSGRLPDPATVAAFGVEEASARDARLLYVAITRARRGLIISYSGALTSLLPTKTVLYEWVPGE